MKNVLSNEKVKTGAPGVPKLEEEETENNKNEAKITLKLAPEEDRVLENTVRKLNESGIEITKKKVLRFVIKRLEADPLSKKIVKAIRQAEDLRRKAEDEAKKIWM